MMDSISVILVCIFACVATSDHVQRKVRYFTIWIYVWFVCGIVLTGLILKVRLRSARLCLQVPTLSVTGRKNRFTELGNIQEMKYFRWILEIWRYDIVIFPKHRNYYISLHFKKWKYHFYYIFINGNLFVDKNDISTPWNVRKYNNSHV